MIDLNNLAQYRENNRIEAKKALGGLPHSIWETYSAFANSLGGLLLLGVEELPDKSLRAVDLPDPEGMVREFWDLVNNPNQASVNILSAKDVTIETVDGKRIVVINIPCAERFDKPVYVNGSLSNTFRRDGEGDHRCSKEEFQAMVRDASVKTQDMLVLEEMDVEVFNEESVHAYRRQMQLSRPDHVWEALEDEIFLLKLGAIGVGGDGQKHPTSAGLLMFGNEYDIIRAFPQYALDYREEDSDALRPAERIVSSSGEWSGNVFDFYFRTYSRLQLVLNDLFEMRGGVRVDDTPVHKAVREALANCLVNSDYYGRGGVAVVRRRNGIAMSNPGSFRIGIAAAKSGGLSDPRNGTMQKMFNLIDVGERTGSGIPNIFRVWREQGWAEPTITQAIMPDRTTLSLVFEKSGRKLSIKKSDLRVRERQRNAILEYLTDHASARTAEIADVLGVSAARARAVLSTLIAEDIVVAEGGSHGRTYRLKA
ncbi:MAG: AAA family ATPase [Ruminococcaceae bacterium]|nr:AAA family ATPase [Oscillospiraceae bacterium]